MIFSFLRRNRNEVFRLKPAVENTGTALPTRRLRRKELTLWIEKAAERAMSRASEAESRGDHEIARIYRLRATLRKRTAQAMRERHTVDMLLR